MYKKIIVSALMLFALVLTGCNDQANSQNSAEKEPSTTNEQENKKEVSEVDRIEVFYFYTSRRCVACQVLEQFTRLTMEEYYQSEMKDGLVVFDSFSVEKAENKEIAQKFKATGSSLFFNIVRDGEDNISQDTQVWRLLNNQSAFNHYLKGKIDNYLE